MLLPNIRKSVLSCREVTSATVEDSLACAREAATQVRQGWLRVIGAPDYKAYLIHHAARHPGTAPMAEREYVNVFIERRFDGRSAGRCC
ncbi:YbdD/YjiX family protein [Bradyrhizobium manausense]|nr:YbdD/YjiX family protein [Bradyrhizobium manausense]